MDFGKCEKTVLPNGVRVLTLSNEYSRTAAVGVWVGSGSAFENEGNTGVSHFIEHMLFKGTERRTAKQLAEETDYLGGCFNAYTTRQYTGFYGQVLSSHICQAVDILADMLLHSKFDTAEIENERNVILEENAMYEDDADDILFTTLGGTIWNGSPLSFNVSGTRETVSSLTREDMLSYMGKVYGAERTVVAVCGRFDREALFDKLHSTFGAMQPCGTPYELPQVESHSGISLVSKDFEQNRLCIAFPVRAHLPEYESTMSVLSRIYGGCSSSHLFQLIREELGLAYSVGSSVGGYKYASVFTVDVGVSGKNEAAALEAIVRELCRLKRDGVTAGEVERAREQIKTGLIMSMESNYSGAMHMGTNELIRGRIPTEDEIIERFDRVTADAVNEEARRFINFDNFTLVGVGKVRDENDYIGVVKNAAF